MTEVPRHMDEHERAEQLPLITEHATVTASTPMDGNRNDEVMDAIGDHLDAIDQPESLADVKDGSEYDWEALWDRLETQTVSDERVEKIKTLTERFDRPYPSLLQLRVQPDTDLDFSPGQYVTLRARDTPRAYSIASPPTEEELEFAIRRVPGGRLTENLFTYVNEGEDVVVRGPNGEMVLDSPSARDVVFLSTGTGVAPFKSMIDFIFERGWDEYEGTARDVWLLQGCGWEDDVPYREAFADLDREHDSFHFIPTLSRESLLTDWDGETDYVQYVFIKHLEDGALDGVELPSQLEPFRDGTPETDVAARIDPKNVDLYACGITAMVQMLVETARSAGVPDEQMQFEGFG